MTMTDQRTETAEEAQRWVRKKIAEQGWTWNVALTTYQRLSPGLSTIAEKLTLYDRIKALSRETEAEFENG